MTYVEIIKSIYAQVEIANIQLEDEHLLGKTKIDTIKQCNVKIQELLRKLHPYPFPK